MSKTGWATFRRMIKPALSDTEVDCTYEQVIEKVLDGKAQSWVMAEAETTLVVGAVVTELLQYESGLKACLIIGCATEDTKMTFESIRSMVAVIETYAKFQGCDILRIVGRRGWGRVLKDFETSYTCFDKVIGGCDG